MRLSKVTKDYNVSLQRVVAVLQEHGVAVEPNLNSKIDDKYAELFAEKFGADKARKDQAEKQFQGRRVEKQQALEQARIEREAEKAAEKAEAERKAEKAVPAAPKAEGQNTALAGKAGDEKVQSVENVNAAERQEQREEAAEQGIAP